MSLRDELVQVAAVALRWIDLLDDPAGDVYWWDSQCEEVEKEVERARALFPEMNNADPGVWLAVLAEEVGEVARCLNETTIAGWRSSDEDH